MTTKFDISSTKAKFEGYTKVTMGINKSDAASSAIDFSPEIHDTQSMTDAVSRYELDAKLTSIEAKMDAKIDRIVESNARIETGMASLKNTVIVTGITAVLAIVFGIAAFNATLLGNMTASFESGKTTATAITQASEELKQTRERLEAISARIDAREQASASQSAKTPDQKK